MAGSLPRHLFSEPRRYRRGSLPFFFLFYFLYYDYDLPTTILRSMVVDKITIEKRKGVSPDGTVGAHSYCLGSLPGQGVSF